MSGKAIYYLLSNHAGVLAIAGTRIYPGKAPQDVSGDYIVFMNVSATPSDTKQDVSRLDANRWQVDGYCEFDDDRDNLEAAIRSALDGHRGTVNGEAIDQIRFLNKNGNFDDDGEMYRTSQDFNIRLHR